MNTTVSTANDEAEVPPESGPGPGDRVGDGGSGSAHAHASVGRPGGRRGVAILAVLLVVAVVVVVVLATRNSSTKPSISVPVSGAVTVQRRDLVQTDTESGTVGYANPRSVYDQLAGTLTWLPSVGALIKPGQRLFEVDDRPVVLMNGTTPAYRELAPGDSDGQDILELNRSLADLGFNPDGIVVDDSWQPATSAGVEAFQKSLGETATGSLPLGQVVFLPGDQIVASVDANLGSPGGGGAGATPILQTTSAHLIVTVDLPPSSQSEARVGEQVSVEMQAGNVVPGVITAVSSVAANGSSAGGSSPSSASSATIPVTIKLRGHVSAAGLDQSSVSVSFAQAVAKNVLSVPVTALLATSGGGFVLQQARAPHRLIAVTTGLFAAGYVQVSGAGIRSGLQVTDSQG